MNIDTKQSVNGCNSTSFSDHGVLKRDCILSSNCHRQAHDILQSLIIVVWFYNNAVKEKRLTYRGYRSSSYATKPKMKPNSLAYTASITHFMLHAKSLFYQNTFTDYHGLSDFVDSLTVYGFLLFTFFVICFSSAFLLILMSCVRPRWMATYMLFNYYIIIIERRDFGGVMSNYCKDTLQAQNKTVRVRRSRTSKVSEQSVYQIQTAAELSESGKLRVNSLIFS